MGTTAHCWRDGSKRAAPGAGRPVRTAPRRADDAYSWALALGSAGFVPKSIDVVLEKRHGCRFEPVSKHMNTEHVDVGPDFSDVGLAEIFIHHRVLIVPVTERKRVIGVITRSDFFTALAERFLANG
jgi:CBS-domain-containing membrane protein